MRTALALLSFGSLMASLAPAGELKFAAPPKADRTGAVVKISFTVSASTDVEVAIMDAKGQVVRHLAAGLLGPNAPDPFKKDSLAQELSWDGKDDAGQLAIPAAGGNRNPFKVRIRLGLGSQLDRFIPAQAVPASAPTAIGVGPDGAVHVLSQRDKAGGASLFVLDRTGKYLRTILPSPANLRAEQVKGLARLKLRDGSEAPVVYSAYLADLAPHLSGLRPQQLAVSKDNLIAFASGGNNWTDQIVPRHALLINSDGATPQGGEFVGPPLGPYGRYSIGLPRQQLAFSPDGKTLYFAGMGTGKKGIHAIGRMNLASRQPEPFIGKPDEAGDGALLNGPVSVATDGAGNVYVVDAGNNRIAGFDTAGKFLGETRVDRPAMAAVTPAGTLFVMTEPPVAKGKLWAPFAVIKFDKAVGGKEVARLDFTGRNPVMAVDPGAKPARVWLTYDPGWQKPVPLMPISDAADKLAAGADVLKDQPRSPFVSPLFLALDGPRDRLYVGDYVQRVLKVDLATDRVSDFLKASEAAVDRDGNVYVLAGYGTNAVLRFDPAGKPLPFTATSSNKIEVAYRAGLPHVGVRGLTVAPNGDLYVFEEVLKPEQLHVFGPDGRLKTKSVVQDIPPDSANSVAVDSAGNIYIGVNVHNPRKLYPDELAGQIPPYAWERTYRSESGWYNWPLRHPPESPWDRLYLNNYLYHYGYVFKFGPQGGRFWTGDKPVAGETPRPEGVPAGAVEYRTGLMKNPVWSVGARWVWQGFGLAANRTESSGDPTCSCYTSRFGMDEYGRLFVPDVFRFCVTALDSAGNEIHRFGRYGNVDSAGPDSLLPEPKVPLTSPNAVAVGRGKVYVADRKSRRIAVVRLTCSVESECPVP